VITNECHYCRSQRHWKLGALQHEAGCPAYGRRLMRMTTQDIEMFIHPDLVELDLEISAWYPQLA
jgi:hypothetical protein